MDEKEKAPQDGTSHNPDGIWDMPHSETDLFVRKWNAIAESEYRAHRRRRWNNLLCTLATMIGVLSVLTLFIYVWVCLFRWVI